MAAAASNDAPVEAVAVATGEVESLLETVQ